MARDEFSKSVKLTLARRVGYLCSNPECNASTSGPHTDPAQSINLGVAAHITAASPGGPRYNPNQTPEERSSIENAIWLCQKCAKLIDSDESGFSLSTLYRWKITAESKALRTLKGDTSSDFFPQPASAIHAPLPRIGGVPYDEAREMLVQAGWQPLLNNWTFEFEMKGNGLFFWKKGFLEIRKVYPTGLAFCDFLFKDVYGNRLIVVTAGEALDDNEFIPPVWSWEFEGEDR